jgi:hypothetical protein
MEFFYGGEMSDVLKSEIAQHVLKNNIMKDDFGWDIPVESVPLPSRGVIYSPDSLLYNKEVLKIKAMTAQEEDILLSQALIKEGTVLVHLINSCLINKDIDVREMIAGDRNALMISIRITGYGSHYPVTLNCDNCDKTNDIDVDLSSLGIKRLSIEPIEQGKNEFSFTLPVTKKNIIFKYLNANDEKNRQAKVDFIEKHSGGMRSNNVTSFLEESIVSIDGIKDKNKITHFVKNMPALDSRKLRDFVNNNSPGIDMNKEYNCKFCGHHNKFSLPINSNFFWPR